MGVRETVATTILNTARSMGRVLGCELVVEASQHSLSTTMERPNTDGARAWDDNLYKHGQLYYAGYANPIKPRVKVDTDLETPDQVAVEESQFNPLDQNPATDGGEITEEMHRRTQGPADDEHTKMISSARYRKYMRQDLISQLLTPRERWRLITYAIIGLGLLQMFGIVMTLYATGSF